MCVFLFKIGLSSRRELHFLKLQFSGKLTFFLLKFVKICFSPRREADFRGFSKWRKTVFLPSSFSEMSIFLWFFDGFLVPAACGSWALPGPPQGVPRGALRSLRELCLKAFNTKSKRRGGRLWEAPGGSRKLRGAPRGSERLC